MMRLTAVPEAWLKNLLVFHPTFLFLENNAFTLKNNRMGFLFIDAFKVKWENSSVIISHKKLILHIIKLKYIFLCMAKKLLKLLGINYL